MQYILYTALYAHSMKIQKQLFLVILIIMFTSSCSYAFVIWCVKSTKITMRNHVMLVVGSLTLCNSQTVTNELNQKVFNKNEKH